RARRARLRGSPSSRDAMAARARQALHRLRGGLRRASYGEIRASVINAICAKVGPQHQTRRVPHPTQQALRQAHNAMKAEEIYGERSLGGSSLGGISAA